MYVGTIIPYKNFKRKEIEIDDLQKLKPKINSKFSFLESSLKLTIFT